MASPAADRTEPGSSPPAGRPGRYLPSSWPIRWKLTVASAAFTLLVLTAFGAAVSEPLVRDLNRIYSDETVRLAETEVARMRQEGVTITPATIGVDANLDAFLAETGNRVQVVGLYDDIYTPPGFPDPGSKPVRTEVVTVRDSLVVSLPLWGLPSLSTSPLPSPTLSGWLRYARPLAPLRERINRNRLRLFGGILFATALVALWAYALARRALRPVADLTAAARQIARTRDPEIRLKEPDVDDEVGELTRTVGDMLHELTLSRNEEERLLQRQREFIADASHELRTPLTSIMANLELLEESAGEDEDDLASARSALRSSRRMRRLVTDLQTLARLDLLRQAELESCDLGRIAAEAVAELKPLAGDGHELVLLEHGPVPVEGLPDDLHRLAANLVNNALRHTPDGTRVEVATGTTGDSQAFLTVSDNGPGIPAGAREAVLERFVQGHGPLDRSGGRGTGLGLAIVKAVAETHGGTITVGESPSGGAEIKVLLPTSKTTEESQKHRT